MSEYKRHSSKNKPEKRHQHADHRREQDSRSRLQVIARHNQRQNDAHADREGKVPLQEDVAPLNDNKVTEARNHGTKFCSVSQIR